MEGDQSLESAVVLVVPHRLCKYFSMAYMLGTPPSDNSGSSRTVRRSYKIGETPPGSP